MAHQDTWDAYSKLWSVPDSESRAPKLGAVLSEGCVYRDPTTRAEGWAELQAYMDFFQQTFPGCSFVTRRFMDHHDHSLANWDMVNAEGEVVSDGCSFGTYGPDGKLLSMTGFFEVP